MLETNQYEYDLEDERRNGQQIDDVEELLDKGQLSRRHPEAEEILEGEVHHADVLHNLKKEEDYMTYGEGRWKKKRETERKRERVKTRPGCSSELYEEV